MPEIRDPSASLGLRRVTAWLGKWLADRAARRAATERANRALEPARDAFRGKYPDRFLFDWRIVDPVENWHIVTVCHGSTRPPRRSWWRVDADGGAHEMAYEVAREYIDIPVWR